MFVTFLLPKWDSITKYAYT